DENYDENLDRDGISTAEAPAILTRQHWVILRPPNGGCTPVSAARLVPMKLGSSQTCCSGVLLRLKGKRRKRLGDLGSFIWIRSVVPMWAVLCI
ncbi:hypothetical protein Dimus_018699, partial [Dionaea muscipula]